MKLTLNDLGNLQNEATTIASLAANNSAIETAIENTLSRDGTTPNEMASDLDMDSYRILNLPEPLLPTEPARLLDLGNAPVYAAAALASQVAAAASAAAVAAAESTAAASAAASSASASAASSSASSASSSASTASTQASNASSSASTAATQAGNAATSASNASTSASNASTSEGNASTSATNASNSASTASTQATNASNSASAASSSASTASTQASNASASAAAAAASVLALTATSTTSLAVGTGSKVFTTQAGKLFVAGQYLNIASNASALNYMHGTVTSYSGTTLTMNITDIGGSGTLADWNISISGTQGSTGATGPSGSLDFGTISDATVADNDYLVFGDVSNSNATRRTLVSTAVQTELTAHASTSRTNLGLVIGTNVQAYDATLGSIASLGTAADKMLYTTGVDTWAELAVTSVGRSLLDDTSTANMRTTLGLVIGTDVQAYDAQLFSNIPQNSQSSAYTLVLTDGQKHIYHPGADTSARTWTIPANSSVAYPIGTAITFVNDTSGGVITIAITTDTLVLAGAGTTGSRSLAANGVATAIKMTSTRWMISGTGLT